MTKTCKNCGLTVNHHWGTENYCGEMGDTDSEKFEAEKLALHSDESLALQSKKPQKGCWEYPEEHKLVNSCPECGNHKWKCKECGSTNRTSYKDLCSVCYNKEWNKENTDNVNKIVLKYRKNNPQKKSVWDKASREIEIKGLCQVCKLRKAEHRHHKDYSKPKDVILICAKCHRNIQSPQNERFTNRRDKCIPKQEGNTLGSGASGSEFDLSKKREKSYFDFSNNPVGFYFEKDIKEFIRKRNKLFDDEWKKNFFNVDKFREERDKLAGKNLSGGD